MISGYGTFHTDKCGDEYSVISFDDVVDKAKNPPSVAKAEAQWLIASSYPSRSSKSQQSEGKYQVLWADFDDKPIPMDDLSQMLKTGFLSDYEFLMYASKSATTDNQKSRLIIPLAAPIGWKDWAVSQQVLNDELDSMGAKTDRVSERAAQLCYLPNKGKFYAFAHQGGKRFDSLASFSRPIAEKIIIQEKAQEQIRCKIKESKKKRDRRLTAGFNSPIDAFNAVYEVEEILLQAGYSQHGDTFSHPESASGSFSASIKDRRVHSLSSSDPLYTGGGGVGAHDSFSAFCVLFHSNDEKAALIDAGDTWLAIDGEPWNKVRQRELMQSKSVSLITADGGAVSAIDQLLSFSAKGQSKQLEEKMLEDVFVLDELAILGQWTMFYASPNTGKTLITLRLLTQAIESGRINGEDIFYINVDDTFRGGIEKLRIAEKFGFHMVISDINDFNKNSLLELIPKLVKEDSARGKIFVIDTLKKFVDLMDKKNASGFGDLARRFVAAGGTMICLAHTNKNKKADGSSQYGGTSDIMDDSDCGFVLELIDSGQGMSGEKTQHVEFYKKKSRGDVAESAGFSYAVRKGASYDDILKSVKRIDADTISKGREYAQLQSDLAADSAIIDSITDYLKEHEVAQKTELVEHVFADVGQPKPKIIKALTRWSGTGYDQYGHRWTGRKGDKNSVEYRLTKPNLEKLADKWRMAQ
jgi:hypothetical protein